jgi:hypothetical protein
VSRRKLGSLGFLALAVVLLACEKLPDGSGGGRGALAVKEAPSPDSVPLAWGNLVSVTVDPTTREALRLWFQNDSGEIRVLNVTSSGTELQVRGAHVIHRK